MNDQTNKNKLTEQLSLFRKFMIVSWPYLDELMRDHDWGEDMDFTLSWLQVNWEFLVEREILGNKCFLTPLSVPLFTRVNNKNVLPNYSVSTMVQKNISDLRTGKKLPKNKYIRFFGFCSAMKEGGFGLYPPFDLAHLVLDSTKELFIIPFSDLEFQLVKYEQ